MQFLSRISTTQIFYQNFASNFKQIKGIYYHHWFSDNFWWEKTLICLHLFNIIIEICRQTIKNTCHTVSSHSFCRGGGLKIFQFGKKGRACNFWIFRGGLSKKEGVNFFRGGEGWGFSESSFQLVIKYYIEDKKNVNYSYNHNHVLYLLTISKYLQPVN